jgi:hypothetical protein
MKAGRARNHEHNPDTFVTVPVSNLNGTLCDGGPFQGRRGSSSEIINE